jgi:hypothetical protein
LKGGKIMAKRLEGNGHSRVNIVIHEKGEGYIIIAPDRVDKLAEHTPIFISRTLETWQKANPACRVRCAVPIVNEAQTVALHVWFDRV